MRGTKSDRAKVKGRDFFIVREVCWRESAPIRKEPQAASQDDGELRLCRACGGGRAGVGRRFGRAEPCKLESCGLWVIGGWRMGM